LKITIQSDHIGTISTKVPNEIGDVGTLTLGFFETVGRAAATHLELARSWKTERSMLIRLTHSTKTMGIEK
jgi:hypothetical protein